MPFALEWSKPSF